MLFPQVRFRRSADAPDCSPLSWLPKLEACSAATAALVPLLEWCIAGPMSWHNIGLEALFAFVYANCIGAILWMAMPAAHTLTARLSAAPRWSLRAATVVLGTAAGLLLGGLLGIALWGSHYGYWTSFWGSLRLALVLSTVLTVVTEVHEHYSAELHRWEAQLRTKELERERALKLATAARLASLESRIHPHFLFNTINSVSSLIHDDPWRAERLLTQMAGLLRFSLDSVQKGLVPLEHEMRIVSDYLDIEKARFEQRLCFAIDIPSRLNGVSVPPLSIQTLVENSVKYAVSPSLGGADIQIRAAIDEETVVVDVIDDGPGFSRTELPAGHGLSNLQERLAVLFGDAAKLDVLSQPGATCVRMTVPLQSMAAPPATGRGVLVSSR
jgi:sensor histidine kinase YesM